MINAATSVPSMRIAIFDYRVTSRNPAGSCHLAMLRALAGVHEFTVFSVEFENPNPQRIEWVRVPVPRRPLALLFLTFHVVAPILYLWHRLTTRKSFDLVQSVESNLGFGDLIYAHFSHSTYLKSKHPGGSGPRGLLRWLDHVLHAAIEPLLIRSAKRVVVPSRGLKLELQKEFGIAEDRVEVIANPICVKDLVRPTSFDPDIVRSNLAIAPSEVVCVFCALGHFERKGLPVLLEALRSPELNVVTLVVVGGEADLVRTYRTRATQLGIESRVRFIGFQQDARPYLWSADAFILPSTYETFSLVAYEAAAAGLPIIAPALHGITDLLADGETGFVIEPGVGSIIQALGRLLKSTPAERMAIGSRAKMVASSYSVERFCEDWRILYDNWSPDGSRIVDATTSAFRKHSGGVASRTDLSGVTRLSCDPSNPDGSME